MFGGLRRHPRSMMVALRFGAAQTGGGHPYAHVQQWLADLYKADMVAFGDKPAEDFVCNIAFAAAGLRLAVKKPLIARRFQLGQQGCDQLQRGQALIVHAVSPLRHRTCDVLQRQGAIGKGANGQAQGCGAFRPAADDGGWGWHV